MRKPKLEELTLREKVAQTLLVRQRIFACGRHQAPVLQYYSKFISALCA